MHHSSESGVEEERHQLLTSLKHTVEGLLANCSNNVWNTYGGLSRLCMVVESILCHKLHTKNLNDNGYWDFLSGLQWLKPTLLPVFSDSLDESGTAIPKGRQWLKNSLQQHILSSQLEVLTTTTDHLLSCYEMKKTFRSICTLLSATPLTRQTKKPKEGYRRSRKSSSLNDAFLCKKEYREALFICLKAVEENQPALLANLDPNLLVKTTEEQSQSKFRQKAFSGKLNINSSCSTLYLNDRNRKTYHKILTTKTGFEVPSNVENVAKLFENSDSKSDKNYILSLEHTFDLMNNSLCSATLGDPIKEMKVPHKDCADVSITTCHIQSCNKSKSVAFSDADEQIDTLFDYSRLCHSCSCPELTLSSNNVPFKLKRGCLRKLSKSLEVLSEPFIIQSVQNSIEVLCDKCKNSDWKRCNLSKPHSASTSKLPSPKEIKFSLSAQSHRNCDSVEKPKSSWKPQHSRSRSDVPHGAIHPIKEHEISIETGSTVSSLSSSLPCPLNNKPRRRSLLEDGSRIGVPTECFFPKPQEGQSLTSFLSSKDFDTCAELDKENAHFCISEALISAIEQMKCNQMLRKMEEDEDDSDEEIQKLKQHIRIRRRERQLEKLRVRNPALLSDGRTDTTTTSASPRSSPYSSTASYEESSGTEDDIDEFELTDNAGSNLTSMQEKGLSLSMASLYSDADIQRINSFLPQNSNTDIESKVNSTTDNSGNHLSAESVALSLLKKFSEKQLPKASDLQWLVSERDAPQSILYRLGDILVLSSPPLLPLPDSWPVSPDIVEEEYSTEKTRLRGNLEWAPPRAQIIFSIHPSPNRKILIAKQNYRCAGCGIKIDRGLISRFRYCEYLGKYFCQCCHNNSMAYIPGRILHKWDFTKYHVSRFSHDLLDRMYADPLFDLAGINNLLFRKFRQLNMVRDYRNQMVFLKDFIRTCRNSKSLKDEIEAFPTHLFLDSEEYSLQDLVQIRKGELTQQLHHLVGRCINHVRNCILCTAKGFICEICSNGNDIIFPFELLRVIQCKVCWACFHKKCFIKEECPKCLRIAARKMKEKEEASFH